MPQLRVLPVDSLIVDEAYQRPRVKALVTRIANNYDPDLVGVLEVSERASGRSAIIDGQQRHSGVVQRGAPSNLRCNVHTGLTRSDEARLFVAFNRERRQVSALERFQAARYYGEPEAAAINGLVEAVGWEVGKCKGGRPETRIEAVATLERIYRTTDGPKVLALALEVLNDIWRGDPKSNHTHWLLGVATFVRRHGTDYTQSQRAALDNIVPAKTIRQAVGDLTTLGGSGAGDSVGRAIAERLRRAASIRNRSLT